MDSFPFNLLLFPLVGGYYIVSRLEWYKYINQRLGSQAKLFNAIIVGIPLLLASLVISALATYFFERQVDYIKGWFPLHDQYFGTCALSFLLAVFVTIFLNKLIDETNAIASAIERTGNELEQLFAISCLNSELIQITLINNKVYIGWVEILPKPSQSSFTYVKLIPLFSGYRDEKKEIHITTNYSEVYASYIKQGKIKAIEDLEMNLVILVNEIVSAARFDFDIFERFELHKQETHIAQAQHAVEPMSENGEGENGNGTTVVQ